MTPKATTIEEALETIPPEYSASIDMDARRRCYLFEKDGYGIGTNRGEWVAYGDGETVQEAIQKAVSNLSD